MSRVRVPLELRGVASGRVESTGCALTPSCAVWPDMKIQRGWQLLAPEIIVARHVPRLCTPALAMVSAPPVPMATGGVGALAGRSAICFVF